MKLILLIARKEFASNIFSFRLLVGLVVCLTLFISSGHVLTKDYEKRLRTYNTAKTKRRGELEKVKVYSQLKVNLDRAPEPLSVLCLGMEKQLGNTVTVSYEDVPTEAEILGGDNPLLMEYMRERGAFSTVKWFTRVNLDELPSQAKASYIWRRYNLDALFDRLFNGSPLSAEERRRLDEGWKAFSDAREAVFKRLRLKSWDEVGPLDLNGMPVFTFERESASFAIRRALPDLAILISLNALLFLGSAAVFLRSEVR
ncbi:hypothetical protein J7M22_06575 [Candidatus Poribacteria bacterium]|nr:hypothetical protein [Candidatus Poribacteria bacterium]